MCRVITAGSVLQGDFTAQMKEEEDRGGHLTSEVPPSCEWIFYRGHTATLPDIKWLHKAIVKSASTLTQHPKGNTPPPPKGAIELPVAPRANRRQAECLELVFSALQRRERTPRARSASAPGADLCCIIALWVKCARWRLRVTSMENPSGKYV